MLATCDEPLLLNFNIYTKVGDRDAHTTIRACTLGDDESTVNYLADTGYVSPDAKDVEGLDRRDQDAKENNDSTCGTRSVTKSSVPVHMSRWETSGEILSGNAAEDLISVADALSKRLAKERSLCDKKVMFAYYHGTLIGLYAGSQVDLVQTSAAMLEQVMDALKNDEFQGQRKALDMCEVFCTAADLFGVVTDASGDFAAVQQIMRSWNEGRRVSETTRAKSLPTVDSLIWVVTSGNNSESTTVSSRHTDTRLDVRAECRSIKVEYLDICDSLAARCGIGLTAFKSFNKGLCGTTLMPGQPVCCSSGTLLDLTPDPNADGSCHYHEVKSDEGCDMIARSYGLEQADLFDLNEKTWGWVGCALQIGCVSEGRPPMPNSVENADCGPTELAELNPCPLDVCCNIWGKCGTTKDFCIKSQSSTGNPGPSKPGENGCVDNCGMELVNNDKGPSQYRNIGYFEGWNYNRPCLNMHVNDIKKGYTHVHFAFGEFSPDLEVVIKDDHKAQWDAFFQAKTDYKKILSFGGWEFSNAPATSGLFRKAVSSANREKFADRVVEFALKHDLDGLDFDWEYPGATDIEGSEPGSEQDGEDYLAFLKLVRQKLPSDKSLAIAAAASFWYLKGFPIKDMAPVLDYIIFMTYDLHGQWDVGREWSMDGCEAGNCLRSHVNATQTFDSLVMMTKAGVLSHKVVVGVTSYGRSFKMADATCRGEMCTFLGGRNDSPAKKGRCTETSGYISNFEIEEIIDKGGAIKSWYDSKTDSDYLVYNAVEWVAYMTELTKSRRYQKYKDWNFGGISDWAIDLQGEGAKDDSDSGSGVVYIDPGIWDVDDGKTGTVQCYPPCTYVFPPILLQLSTTISFRKYTTSLEVGWFTSTEFERGYSTITTTVYKSITHTTVITPSPVTLTEMPVRNVVITDNVTDTTFRVTHSIVVPTTVITNKAKSSDPTNVSVPPNTRTIYPPPWPWPENEEDEDEEEDDYDSDVIGPPIIHNTGPDGPLCRSGCGMLCRFLCDKPCLFNCNWRDAHPPGFQDSVDPRSPLPYPTAGPTGPNDPDNDCEEITFDSCREICIQASTEFCTASCSEVTECISTSDIPETMTMGPIAANTRARPNPREPPLPFSETLSAAVSAIAYLSELGDWTFGEAESLTSKTERPTSTVSYAYPTNNDIDEVMPACYKDYDPPENAKFSVDGSYPAVAGFCNQDFVLRPNDVAKIYEYDAGDYYVWAIMGWAPNQSGCGDKIPHYPSGETIESWQGCIYAFDLILAECEGPDYDSDEDVYQGGGWVTNSGVGCVLVRILATTDRSAPLRTVPESHQQEFEDSGDVVKDMWGFDLDEWTGQWPLLYNVTIPERFRGSLRR
ncbi:uncharacterized protein F5Z01DRAFT_695689 [Emericellopsis atlantica]|uniref:chitinase n=1 Tax=Emericellopsis atlantica TaxID=2614577 RepID=A0A9P8CKK6_9HYPO|nr:uncharacterized protein F5Z01DRAFT_695689 [Emericellopsis atlantica]KAG9250035.1 hypothetical protein F5Z01DRAFT_695689 [Emericellopsis atlantica]